MSEIEVKTHAGRRIREDWLAVFQILEAQCRRVHFEILRQNGPQSAASGNVAITETRKFEAVGACQFIRREDAFEFTDKRGRDSQRCGPYVDFIAGERWVPR